MNRGRDPLKYLLISASVIILYAYVLVAWGDSYLMRRDENSVFLIARALDQGTPINQLFISIQPGFLAITQFLASDGLVLYRVFAMLSATIVVLATISITNSLNSNGELAGQAACATMLSSALFLGEGTYFRGDLPSLALAILGLRILIRAKTRQHPFSLLIAGILLGLAVTVKVLALSMLPVYFGFLLNLEDGWSREHLKLRLRQLLVSVGLALIGFLLVIATFYGSQAVGSTEALTMNLQMSARADMRIILNHFRANIVIAASDMLGPWLVMVVLHLRVLSSPSSPERDAARKTALLMDFWIFSLLAAFFVNFPDWPHHYTYLVPPLAIAVGTCLSLLNDILTSHFETLGKTIITAVIVVLSLRGSVITCTTFDTWLPTDPMLQTVSEIRSGSSSSAVIWSDNHVFPLVAERDTDPWLVEVSWKRLASGALTERDLIDLFVESPPSAVVFWDGLFAACPRFTQCIRTNFADGSPLGAPETLYWIDARKVADFSECVN